MVRGISARTILFFSFLLLFISCIETHTSEVKDKNALIEKGIAHQANSEFNLAAASFSEAISKDPKDPLAWKLRGASYYRLNEFRRAVADLDEAISLDHTAADAYLYRGNAYGEMDMFAKAIEDFDRARKLRDGGYFDNLNQSYLSILNKDFLVEMDLLTHNLQIIDVREAVVVRARQMVVARLVPGVSVKIVSKGQSDLGRH